MRPSIVLRRLALPALALAASACVPPEDGPGRAIFASAGCQSCHRVGSMGGTSGPDLTLVGFRRSREWLDLWLKDPRGWKKEALMPGFRLSDGDRAALVDYLASLRGRASSPHRAPWDAPGVAGDPVAQGRIIYQKAGCAACHGPAGRGGEPNNNVPGGAIPALDKLVGTYTREELVRRIRDGSRPQKDDPSGAEPMVRMPAWGETLSDEELDAVASYLFTLAQAAGAEADF